MTPSDIGGEIFQEQYDWSTERPSGAVIEAISEVENTDPIELPVILYEYIDPEALDALVTTDSNVSVSFTVGEYRVHIEGNRVGIVSH